ncbi:MAG: DUF533 domain-containing protein [Synergistaceae bacterium]|jgi:uncharacterized membrane protein YebE (DUF533 family)|nr:DUF533 domain-containing protein [Synergistaceae bacterium]
MENNNLMDNLQSLLGAVAGASSAGRGNNAMGGLLGGLLSQGIQGGLTRAVGPSLLGGLAGALMGTETGRKTGSNALLVGGGLALGALAWNKYKQLMQSAGPAPAQASNFAPMANAPSAPVDERVKRFIRAMVFAAKADGHIDETEHRNIIQKIKELSLGAEAEQVVNEAIQQPLDPEALARGVQDHDEALEIYVLSRSVIDVDQFMERNYLDALAHALNIPDSVKQAIEQDIASQQR